MTAVAVVAEVKQIEQVANRGTVQRHVGIELERNRIRKIIAAPIRQRLQIPIAFDELQNRNVVRILVADVAAFRKRRDSDQQRARAIAEEVQRLDVGGVVQ